MSEKQSILLTVYSFWDTVPASARPATRSVRVNNLVRPFTEKGLRALLSETGTIEEHGFWMDSIKTHCFVTVRDIYALTIRVPGRCIFC